MGELSEVDETTSLNTETCSPQLRDSLNSLTADDRLALETVITAIEHSGSLDGSGAVGVASSLSDISVIFNSQPSFVQQQRRRRHKSAQDGDAKPNARRSCLRRERRRNMSAQERVGGVRPLRQSSVDSSTSPTASVHVRFNPYPQHAATFSTATGAEFLRRHQRCFSFSALRGAFRRASSSSANDATSHANSHRSASHLRQLFASRDDDDDQRQPLLSPLDNVSENDDTKVAKTNSAQATSKSSSHKSHVTFVEGTSCGDKKATAKTTSKFRVSKTTAISSSSSTPAKCKNQQVSFYLKINSSGSSIECRNRSADAPPGAAAVVSCAAADENRASHAATSDSRALPSDIQLRQRHRSAPDGNEHNRGKSRHFSGNS